ncbi:S8 family peptidase [Motiliproteus sediminis]|uniref:S8 family peptidase n=1 Tax=Motiliproteus sediminis TaxID=1468178 RepID=UPI001AEFD56B|nr:S8 family peptidase [Motiliproteus sediminis]
MKLFPASLLLACLTVIATIPESACATDAYTATGESYTLVANAVERIAQDPLDTNAILINAGRDSRYRNLLDSGDLELLLADVEGGENAVAEAAEDLVTDSPYKLVSVHKETIGRVSLAQLNALEASLRELVVEGRLIVIDGALLYEPPSIWPKVLLGAGAAAGIAAAAGGGGGGGGDDAPPPWTAPSFAVSANYSADYRHRLVGTEQAHARGLDGSGVTVGVIDSGFRTTHTELSGQFVAYYNAYTTNTGAGDVADLDGHGTFIAGVLAAKVNGNGVTGVAPGAQLIGVRIGDNVDGSFTLSDAQTGAAIDYTVAQGADFVNNSWGVGLAINSVTKAAIEAARPAELQAYRDAALADVVMVFANGNDAPTLTQPNIQAGLPFHFAELREHWVAVGAVGADGLLTDYSQPCGVAAGWCLVAPGGETGNLIISSFHTGDDTYAQGFGTSAATPMVTGALAVLKQRFPTLTNDVIVDRLFLTANKTGPYANSAIYGQGLLDLNKATDPVGPLAVVNPLINKSQGQPSLALNEVNLALSNGYGASLAEVLAGNRLAVADTQGAGFFINFDQLVTPAPGDDDLEALLADYRAKGLPASGFIGSAELSIRFSGTGDQARVERLQVAAQSSNWRYQWGMGQQPDSLLSPSPADSFTSRRFGLPIAEEADRYWSAAGALQWGDWTLGSMWVMPARMDDESAAMQSRAASLGLGWRQPAGVLQLGLQLGVGEEQEGMLGADFSGAFGIQGDTPYRFASFWGELDLTTQTRLQAMATMAWLQPGLMADSLITDISEQRAETMAFWLQHQLDSRQQFGVGVSQPLRLASGRMTLTYSDGYEGNQFNTRRQQLDLSAGARQLDYELFYRFSSPAGLQMKSSLIYQHNAGHRAGETNAMLLLAAQQPF